MQRRMSFPFSAVVALDKLKLAILINAINPKIGGVLIRGPKGTGKTTVVRGLADILPKIQTVQDCPFNCNPIDPSNMCPKCSERYHKEEKLPSNEREMTVVNLPLGATEDRVVGSLDVEKAIKLGVEALEPGILAEANQNILYVDEINLLPDHIADDLLDAAATGWNVVEREGISVSHPSRFVFIGTMNPEEGELRPQLLDRFPLSVGVEKISSVNDRMEVVKRNIEFEENPEKFNDKYEASQEELRNRIIQARDVLPKVEMPEQLLEAICKACLDLKVDGMRPDIVISKAASTLTAFEGRTKVTLNDVLVASELALTHRTREGGFLEPAASTEIKETFVAKAKEVRYLEEDKSQKETAKSKDKGLKGRAMIWAWKEDTEKKERSLKKRYSKIRSEIFKMQFKINRLLGGITFAFGKKSRKSPKEETPVLKEGLPMGSKTMRGQVSDVESKDGTKAIPSVSSALGTPQLAEGLPVLEKVRESILSPFKLFFRMRKPLRKVSRSVGKRAETVTLLHRGRERAWRLPHGKPSDIHLPATIRTAAKRQKYREKPFEVALKICLEDVREKLRLYKTLMTIVFVIDLSGSMLFSLEEVKEAILKLHRDAYRYRDKVGIVALKETGAVVVQHPITNLRVVASKLLRLKISGFTPLATGMLKAWEVLKEAKRRDRATIPVMAIITDGSANVPLQRSLETGETRTFDTVGIAVRKYEDLAIKDVMAVSRMIKREGIYTVVVNTNPHMTGRETYGSAVTQYIASTTNGTHHKVGRITSREEFVERIFEDLAEDQRRIAHDAAESLKPLLTKFD